MQIQSFKKQSLIKKSIDYYDLEAGATIQRKDNLILNMPML